ncbi:MAG: hypothetical protein KOO62_05410 [candidate division Zixibacteria bacterium]|nr:hypothetical protein [candidate division Zixibacteria bacterium]
MKVAIPIWNGRVSPVMDTACRLLVVEFSDSVEVSREAWDIPQVNIPYRVSFFIDRGIDVLICGAISHQFERMLSASGIKTVPWFGGNVDEIVTAYADGSLQNNSYRLPGCGRRRRQGMGRCRGRRTELGRYKQFEEE